jgi:hypothetical protein
MKATLVVMVTAVALVGAACGASGGDSAKEGESSTSATTAKATNAAASADFGTLKAPCGKGDYTVKAGEQGKGADKLYIGIGNDRRSQIRPGLDKELWDAGVAYADWCNAQGGIGGLEIVPVDLEASIFEVEKAMTTACTDVFAMVGGGLVQDNLEFSGKDSSDFHKCKLIDLPAYAVSPQKSDSNGQVQPVPNPGSSVANTYIRDYKQLYPDEAKKVAIAYGDLPSLDVTRQKNEAALKDVGMDLVGAFPFPPTGLTDWTPLAQKIIDSGATTLMFVGEAGQEASLMAKLKEQNWKGRALLETNMYDPLLFSTGDQVAEGSIVRMTTHPLEEADQWPGMKKYLDLLKTVPDARVGPLGVQAMSAWLLFTTAANACAEKNKGVLDRTCILQEAAATSDWTGGGLHASADPARYDEAKAQRCGMLLVVKDGKFERLYPKVGGKGDDGDGFHCPADGASKVAGGGNLGNVDPSRPI